MEITHHTLPSMERIEAFREIYCEYAKDVLGRARLYPKISIPRLIEAHGAWCTDLNRVGSHEPDLDDGLDHFKRSGHLAFWLRRMSPVVEAIDLTTNVADAEGLPLTGDEIAFRELLFGYCNEYLAFDFGYQFCKFYETQKDKPSTRAKELLLSEDYYQTTCHFMKYKNVSPHALFLIYKSLFIF